AVLTAATLGLAGCGGGHNKFVNPGGSAGGSAGGAAFAVTPADGAAGIPVSAEIQVGGGAKLAGVELTGGDGKSVAGALRSDGTSWVPDEPLDYTTTYTAKVTAKTGSRTDSRTVKFTTMSRPGNRMEAHLYMADNATYGRAMPLVVEFKEGGVAKA